jgi:hypothetical protein
MPRGTGTMRKISLPLIPWNFRENLQEFSVNRGFNRAQVWAMKELNAYDPYGLRLLHATEWYHADAPIPYTW